MPTVKDLLTFLYDVLVVGVALFGVGALVQALRAWEIEPSMGAHLIIFVGGLVLAMVAKRRIASLH